MDYLEVKAFVTRNYPHLTGQAYVSKVLRVYAIVTGE